MIPLRPIRAPDLPAPGGHYSHGIEANGFVFVSGQLPVTPQGHVLQDAPFEAQARQALDNCAAVLAAAGCTLSDVVKTTAFLVGSEHWGAFNRLYAERLGAHKPARAVVPVPELHYGYLIEIEMIALRRS